MVKKGTPILLKAGGLFYAGFDQGDVPIGPSVIELWPHRGPKLRPSEIILFYWLLRRAEYFKAWFPVAIGEAKTMFEMAEEDPACKFYADQRMIILPRISVLDLLMSSFYFVQRSNLYEFDLTLELMDLLLQKVVDETGDPSG